jgi:hypothetical protein
VMRPAKIHAWIGNRVFTGSLAGDFIIAISLSAASEKNWSASHSFPTSCGKVI